MQIRQTRDLAIKLLGLYYFVHGLIYLPQILIQVAWSGKESEYVTHPILFFLAALFPVLTYFAFAYLVLFKSRLLTNFLWPHDTEQTSQPAVTLSLAAWISIIGFFYLVGSLADAATELWILGVQRPLWGTHIQYKLFPKLMTVFLALICIVKARPIAAYLKSKTE